MFAAPCELRDRPQKGPLHVPMQSRLYHEPNGPPGASGRLAVLPCGIVVTPSPLLGLGTGLPGLGFPRFHLVFIARLGLGFVRANSVVQGLPVIAVHAKHLKACRIAMITKPFENP